MFSRIGTGLSRFSPPNFNARERKKEARFSVPVHPTKNNKKTCIVLLKFDLIIMYAIIRKIEEMIGNSHII